MKRKTSPNTDRLQTSRAVPVLLSALFVTIQLSIGCSINAYGGSSDYRWGFAFGYGAEGIVTTATSSTSNGVTTTTPAATRAEEPLVAEIFLDRFITDRFFLTFSHSRGVSVVPFSSGESFTGVAGQWYLIGPAPADTSPPDEGGATLFIKRWAPFIGLSTGISQASITRDATLTPTVSGSGVYLGTRLGFDYPTGQGHGLRPEIVYSTTTYSNSFSNSSTPAPVLSQFSLQCGWYFDF